MTMTKYFCTSFMNSKHASVTVTAVVIHKDTTTTTTTTESTTTTTEATTTTTEATTTTTEAAPRSIYESGWGKFSGNINNYKTSLLYSVVYFFA